MRACAIADQHGLTTTVDHMFYIGLLPNPRSGCRLMPLGPRAVVSLSVEHPSKAAPRLFDSAWTVFGNADPPRARDDSHLWVRCARYEATTPIANSVPARNRTSGPNLSPATGPTKNSRLMHDSKYRRSRGICPHKTMSWTGDRLLMGIKCTRPPSSPACSTDVYLWIGNLLSARSRSHHSDNGPVVT
jgi:hypothetical protein